MSGSRTGYVDMMRSWVIDETHKSVASFEPPNVSSPYASVFLKRPICAIDHFQKLFVHWHELLMATGRKRTSFTTAFASSFATAAIVLLGWHESAAGSLSTHPVVAVRLVPVVGEGIGFTDAGQFHDAMPRDSLATRVDFIL